MRTEINRTAEALFQSRNGDMVAVLNHFQQLYHELNIMTKLVAEMRLMSNPNIVVMNDTPYIKVETRDA